jgi:hypothetical protein
VNTFAIGHARYFDLLDLAPDIERAAAALSGRLQFLLNDGGWCIHQVLHKINETTHVALIACPAPRNNRSDAARAVILKRLRRPDRNIL